MNYRKLATVTAIVSLMASAACAAEDITPEEQTDTTVRTVLPSDTSSFDPALAQGQQSFQVANLLYDTVLRRDEGSKVIGGLATDWEAVSASEYTFTIRDDATCSDGTEITAKVVADSLRRLADPATTSTWRNLVFGQGKVEVTATDATVRIVLSSPYATLPQALTISQSGIVCPAGLADPKGLAAGTVKGAFSGPYTVEQARQGVGYTFGLREDYDAWPKFGKPLTGEPPSKIELSISTDQSTVANQILAGDVELGQFADPDVVKRFESQPELGVFPITQASTYVVFNQRPGRVFADKPELRRGVASAIDQKAFNAVFSKGTSELLTSISPESFPCVSTDRSLLTEHDADAAKQALNGVKGIKVIGNTANRQYSGGADYIYQVLTDAGAEVELEKVDNATFWSTIAEGGSDWDIVFLGDLNSVGSVSASLDRVMGPSVDDGGRNYSASVNPEGEAALAEGLAATDEESRCAAYERAQQTLFERQDVVPLVGGPLTYVTSAGLSMSVFDDYADWATLRFGAS